MFAFFIAFKSIFSNYLQYRFRLCGPNFFFEDAALQGNYWSSTSSGGFEAEKLLWLNWQIAGVVLWLLSIRIAAASSDTVFGIKTKEKVVRWGVIHIRVWRHRIGHGLANGQAKETCPRIWHSERMSIGQLCVKVTCNRLRWSRTYWISRVMHMLQNSEILCLCGDATWLILPVVICLSQRLSHACLSISFYTAKLRMAH